MALWLRHRQWWPVRNTCVFSQVQAPCGAGAQADKGKPVRMVSVDLIPYKLQWVAQSHSWQQVAPTPVQFLQTIRCAVGDRTTLANWVSEAPTPPRITHQKQCKAFLHRSQCRHLISAQGMYVHRALQEKRGVGDGSLTADWVQLLRRMLRLRHAPHH